MLFKKQFFIFFLIYQALLLLFCTHEYLTILFWLKPVWNLRSLRIIKHSNIFKYNSGEVIWGTISTEMDKGRLVYMQFFNFLSDLLSGISTEMSLRLSNIIRSYIMWMSVLQICPSFAVIEDWSYMFSSACCIVQALLPLVSSIYFLSISYYLLVPFHVSPLSFLPRPLPLASFTLPDFTLSSNDWGLPWSTNRATTSLILKPPQIEVVMENSHHNLRKERRTTRQFNLCEPRPCLSCFTSLDPIGCVSGRRAAETTDLD